MRACESIESLARPRSDGVEAFLMDEALAGDGRTSSWNSAFFSSTRFRPRFSLVVFVRKGGVVAVLLGGCSARKQAAT